MTPVLFISHGAPTLALNPGKTGELLHSIVAEMPAIRAILVISAHWDTSIPAVSLAAYPETIYDFGGFPQELYELTYPAPGAPGLARKTIELLENAGMAADSEDRGLDHGAWVPLRLLYPHANIPVTQLSIQSVLGPYHHYRLGQALRQLREEGVLIMTSGAITHNLYDFRNPDPDAPALPYVHEFSNWIAEQLNLGDETSLLDYRRRAPFAERSHPTEDHLLPLFVALGASDGDEPVRYNAGVTYGILEMDHYRFG